MEFKITAPQWNILAAVAFENCKSPSEIASLLGIDGAAVTRHLDTLEKKELLKRQQAPADRRALKIELTTKGSQLAPWIRDAAKAVEEQFTGRLTEEQLGQFQEMLRILRGETPVQTVSQDDWERS